MLFPGLETALRILLILLLAWLVHVYSSRLLAKITKGIVKFDHYTNKEEAHQRERTLQSILSAALRVIAWIVATILILSELGIELGPILASAGVLGVALGFGAQTLIRDFLAGVFILLENQYRVGDVLQVNQGVIGTVEDVSLRMTRMRDIDGNVHHIPNGEIKLATNMSMDYAQVDITVSVAYDSDIDRVEEVINGVGKQLFEDEKWKEIALEAPYMLRVDSLSDSSVDVKVLCKTTPGFQWKVKGELLRRLKKAFDKEGIEIPFPHTVVKLEKK